MTLTAPQYTITPGYCLLGMNPGFSVGTGTNGNLATALTNLGTHLGTTIEALSRGLPNDLGDASSALAATLNFPGHCMWAGPLVPMSGSTTLTQMIDGALDAQLEATGAAFVTHRNAGLPGTGFGGDTIRMGWEYDFSNYKWGINVNGNTYTLIAQAMDRYITKVRAGGYRGRFCVDAGYVHTGSDPSAVISLMANADLVDEFGVDFYNNMPGAPDFGKDGTWESCWARWKPGLDSAANWCRANGKTMSFPECGVLIVNNVWHTNDTGTFYTDITGWAAVNADVMTAIYPYNQNGYSGSAVVELDQRFYCGSPSGTAPVSITNLGSWVNTSTTGPWVDSTSSLDALATADARAKLIAGTMQLATQPVQQLSGSRTQKFKVYSQFNPFG